MVTSFIVLYVPIVCVLYVVVCLIKIMFITFILFNYIIIIMKCLNLIKKYVPRHIRLGLCVGDPGIQEAMHDVVEAVPVVDSDGSVVRTYSAIKSIPVVDHMRKYKLSKFRLSALLQSGVPLKVVNINQSNIASIEQLKRVCDSIGSAEDVVQRFENERKERESWFVSPESTDDVSNVSENS